ncbi:MAG: hypothetical protein ACI9N1_000436 [Flavobacteriales bacterium]|jgi:hypothetical protein
MKNITITTLLFLFSFSIFGQTNTEKLPTFYDQLEGNKVVSVDMISDGVGPIVIYTTFNQNDVKCKQWDGQEWVTFGTFPKFDNRGTVVIAKNKKQFYALVQNEKTWSILTKKGESWKVLGTLSGADDLSTPTLTFIDEVPVVYEVHYRNSTVMAHTFKGGKFINISSTLEGLGKVKSDFVMLGKKENHMILAYTSYDKNSLELFEINQDGTETNQKTITKGLKTKDIGTISSMFYSKGKLHLIYAGKDDLYKHFTYNESSEKWEEVAQGKESHSGLGLYMAADLSFVSKYFDNDLPVFYKYNGTNWDAGIELGSIKIYQGETVKLAEALGEYYLLNDTAKDGYVIQKIN